MWAVEDWADDVNLGTRIGGGFKGLGGLFETAAGAGFGISTSWTGFGGVAGGVVALHGIDTTQSGFRQLWTGEIADSLTSKGMQAVGVSQNTANLIDTGISFFGSLGTGAIAGGIRTVGVATADDLAASGYSGWKAIQVYEKANKAVQNIDEIGGIGASTIQKYNAIQAGAAGTQGLHPVTAVMISGTGLTPLAQTGAGVSGALLTGTAGYINNKINNE